MSSSMIRGERSLFDQASNPDEREQYQNHYSLSKDSPGN